MTADPADREASRSPDAPLRPRVPDGERVYAIGDVHGQIDLFDQLIGLIRADNAARAPALVRLVLIGDIVDRGPESAELVRRCRAFTKRTDRFIVLKGNHEAVMVSALSGDLTVFQHWLRNGGDAALLSWGVNPTLIADHALPKLLRAARARVGNGDLDWMDALPLTYRVGDYLFVHAGIRPEIELEEQTERDLLWIRDGFLDSEVDHPFMVVHGHTISAEVDRRRNRIGIDTGAYRTGVLSALALEAEQQWVLATGV